MNINGITLNLNVADADETEMFEKCISEVSEKMSELSDEDSYAESIRKQCHIIFDMFNNLFGEGTDRKIFGEKTDLLKCLDAFESLVNQVNTEKDKLKKKIADKAKRYQL